MSVTEREVRAGVIKVSIDILFLYTIICSGKEIIFFYQKSFNTNISHQPFDYKITFMDLQHENTNSKKVILNSKTGFKHSF